MLINGILDCCSSLALKFSYHWWMWLSKSFTRSTRPYQPSRYVLVDFANAKYLVHVPFKWSWSLYGWCAPHSLPVPLSPPMFVGHHLDMFGCLYVCITHVSLWQWLTEPSGYWQVCQILSWVPKVFVCYSYSVGCLGVWTIAVTTYN